MKKIVLSVLFVFSVSTYSNAEDYTLIGKLDNNSVIHHQFIKNDLYLIRSNDANPYTTLEIYKTELNSSNSLEMKLVKAKKYKYKSTKAILDKNGENLYLTKDNQINKIRLKDSLNIENINIDNERSIKSISLCESQNLVAIGNSNYSMNLFKKDKNNKYVEITNIKPDYSRLNMGYTYIKFSPDCKHVVLAGDDEVLITYNIDKNKIENNLSSYYEPVFFNKNNIVFNSYTGITQKDLKTGEISKITNQGSEFIYQPNFLVFEDNNLVTVKKAKKTFKIKTDYKNPITKLEYNKSNNLLLINSFYDKNISIYKIKN